VSRPANPHAMAPATPGRTRTAPPVVSDGFWSAPRMRRYLLFDATGVTYLLVGFAALWVAFGLGGGRESWEATRAALQSPLWIAFHALVLASVLYVGVRFFALFPKAQPARLGPAKPPPRPVLHATLYAAWGALTVALVLVLGGFLP